MSLYPTLATLLVALTAAPAFAQTVEDRLKRGDAVIKELNRGQPQPALERMRQEFPFLAEATEAYALGDVWSRPGLDNRTRQLAAVAAFAATGQLPFMKVHAGYALNIGVPEEELKEIVYMITVPAAFRAPSRPRRSLPNSSPNAARRRRHSVCKIDRHMVLALR